MLEKVRHTIKKYSMLSGGEKVLIALSGGPDSVCLLHILRELSDELHLALAAVYIDHGLRPDETPREIRFCADLCSDLGLDFLKREIAVKESPLVREMGKQAAARELRYRALQEAAFEVQADRIATAHHKNDLAETVIINLLRGSGLKGLGGMSPVRKNIIRPLLDIGKEEIEAYLSSHNIRSMTDSSNLENDYLRNKIRFSVIPELEALNPSVIETLSRTSKILREENDYLDIQVTKAMMRLFSRKSDTRIELFLSPMETIPDVILRRILKRVAAEIKDIRPPSFRNIEDIIMLIKRGTSGDRIYLPDNLRVIRGYSLLILTTETWPKLKDYTLEIGDELLLPEAHVIISASVTDAPSQVDEKFNALFDVKKITMPLRIRPRAEGDYFYPSHFDGKKKIQDFFVDEKIPRDERDSTPLICSGDDIIWVFGHRTDGRFIPDEDTKEFLALTSRGIKK